MENSANQISPDQSAVKNLNPSQLKSTIKFKKASKNLKTLIKYYMVPVNKFFPKYHDRVPNAAL
jgi:hypothetical protein